MPSQCGMVTRTEHAAFEGFKVQAKKSLRSRSTSYMSDVPVAVRTSAYGNGAVQNSMCKCSSSSHSIIKTDCWKQKISKSLCIRAWDANRTTKKMHVPGYLWREPELGTKLKAFNGQRRKTDFTQGLHFQSRESFVSAGALVCALSGEIYMVLPSLAWTSAQASAEYRQKHNLRQQRSCLQMLSIQVTATQNEETQSSKPCWR